MDLLKTPSVQSLLDSDLESVDSLQCLDIEELDEIEYALPASEAPTLAEVLSTQEDDEHIDNTLKKHNEEPFTCSALQVDFLQAISQQLMQAQERSSAAAATALSVGTDGKLTVGTAHGHLLSFFEQTLRWVCDSNTDRGAVSCLAYNKDSTRLLVGYARGLICQYESTQGTILRRVTTGGDIWGTLRVTWAGTSGLVLDTGGSVWLVKFSRPLGVRAARTSCLFSGARGEVVAMSARDARVLALATLSRIIIVAGGRAAGLRLNGPPDTMPVLEWFENDERILVCARSKTLQWLALNITGTSISLKPMRRVELKTTPLWLGWLGGNLAIFDADENLRLWGDEYDKPLDLSHIEPVYASTFFKGHWTDGRVSRAMCIAGGSALGGACVCDGALSLLGRRGVVRVRSRDLLARAEAFLSSGHHMQALRLLCSTQGEDAKALANNFVANVSQRPHVLSNKQVADHTVKLCLKYHLNELWSSLWDQCSNERPFVEALGDAVVRGDLTDALPSPDSTQALIERLADFEPSLVERVLASLPLTSLDPHRASVFTRERRLWRGFGAVAAALGGYNGALRALCAHVDRRCSARRGSGCVCAGAALLLAAADALAGRVVAGRTLPSHARPSASHDALLALLAEQEGCGGRSALRVLVEHEAGAAMRLLEQSSRDVPFAGPLAKQNRLRVARALLSFAHHLPEADDRIEVLEFITGQFNANALPSDQDAVKDLQALAATTRGERSDRALLVLATRGKPNSDYLVTQYNAAVGRPRVRWRLASLLETHEQAIHEFFKIESPSKVGLDEFFDYLHSRMLTKDISKAQLEKYIPRLIELRPRATAALVIDHFVEFTADILKSLKDVRALEFAESVLESRRLQGDAAAAHLRNLCAIKPAAVQSFLLENPGLIRPEEALAIVREVGPQNALPICLEAAGDPTEALEVMLRLVVTDAEEKTHWIQAAGELCTRIAPTVPRDTAADMWLRLLRNVSGAPPALLLEAVAYLPVEVTVGKMCNSALVASAMLACAARRRTAWECTMLITGREAHEALARALCKDRRGIAVRGRCQGCGSQLADAPVLTAHCARAFHVHCEPETRCGECSRRLPDSVLSLPSKSHRRPSTPPPDLGLVLVAPPRPDLEGVV